MPLLQKSVIEQFENRKSAGGNYLNPGSLQEGEKTRITLLGDDSATGWEIWADSASGKRVALRFADQPSKADLQERCKEMDCTIPNDAVAKQFMAFAIWNYEAECVQVFQFSQVSLIKPFIDTLSDDEVGQEPHLYDFSLSVSGQGRDKRYSVTSLPGRRRKADVDQQISAAWEEATSNGFNIRALLNGGDPFKGNV